MRDTKETLSNFIADRKVLPVLGAGISYATAGIPGWRNLIINGLAYAKSKLGNFQENEISHAQDLLSKNNLIDAASALKKLLGANHEDYGAYNIWLESFFKENREIKSLKLIKSIKCLLTPFLVTTNYDNLLGLVQPFDTPIKYDWGESDRILNAINDDEEFVLHLHGIYSRIRTVVFGREDYEALNLDKPYKSLLRHLWHKYHMLFIGCSRDGVLDQDFLATITYMHKLFPESTQVHYLLVNDDDQFNRLEFLAKYKIEAISYGNNHDLLPDFIDSINPNLEKAKEKFLGLAKRAMAHFQDAAETFFTNPQNWKRPVALEALHRSVEVKNLQYLSRRDQFSFLTETLKKFISVKDVECQVELWNKYGNDDTSKLSNEVFLKAGILSYEALKNIPDEILKDIHYHKYGAIHPGWFNNHLSSFIFEFRELQKVYQDEVYNFLRGDRYFFENLKRIMTSFLGIIKITPESLYPEVVQAQRASEFPEKILLVCTEKQIVLRNLENMTPFASVDAESEGFRMAQLIDLAGTLMIIGASDGEAFYWNPLTDDTQTIFFKAETVGLITEVINEFVGDRLVTLIKTTDGGYRFIDFEKIETFDLRYWVGMIALDQTNILVGLARNERDLNGTFLFIKHKYAEDRQLLTLSQIWIDIQTLPGMTLRLNSLLVEQGVDSLENLHGFPFISNAFIKKTIFQETEYITIRVTFAKSSFDHNGTTILLHYRLENNIAMLAGFHVLDNGLSLTFDTYKKNDNDLLLVGYLDLGANIKLVETYETIKVGNYFTGKLSDSYYQSNDETNDIYQIINLSNETVILNESGKRIIILNRNTGISRTLELTPEEYIYKIDAKIRKV